MLVLNTSGTLPAAVDAVDEEGRELALHFSSPAPNASDALTWVVEARLRANGATTPFAPVRAGAVLSLAGGGRALLLAPHARRSRLWIARLELSSRVEAYLAAHGRPIRYGYVDRDWPIDAYQTVYATEPGSAEMPSAGRPLTERILTRLIAEGVLVAPLVLHTGVSSLESDEPPYPERFRVPRATAALVNAARSWGGRVIAVGTTAVRALEGAVDDHGAVGPARGVDGRRRHPRARRPSRRRHPHGLARAEGDAPADADGDRRRRPRRCVIPCRARGRLSLARVRRSRADPPVTRALGSGPWTPIPSSFAFSAA